MAQAIVNGIELNYEISGNGTPLVLIHGHPFDHTMWRMQVPAFSEKYSVITPDLRGYGKSSVVVETKFEDYASDVIQLLDFLKVDKFHIMGLSLGGQIIMEIFRQAPNRVLSMVLADTFASPDTPEVKQGRYDVADRLEKEGMHNYAEEVIYKMIKPAHVTSMPAVAAFVINMMKASSPVGAAAALRARAGRINYLKEVFPQIKIPTLVIVGQDDEFTPVKMAEEMKANLIDGQLSIIEDAGHMTNMEQPNQFNDIILNFLATI